jgi:MSHA biogenesis protein MshI
LLLEELPNTPRSELVKAIAWRIRDRIDIPLDEAVIELLEMPAQARAGQKPSAYAAVTQRSVIAGIVQSMRRGGLKPDAIDLPELCMRNIAARLPQDTNGVAFLHFTTECGLLTVTRQGILYLIRRIDVGQLALDGTSGTQIKDALIPSICLELQRSLDYYETHYDCRPITDLVLGPGSGIAPLREALREQLGLNVSSLDLASMFDMQEDLDDEVQSECLLAIGAALRADGPTVRES